jgi:hypothetical protein
MPRFPLRRKGKVKAPTRKCLALELIYNWNGVCTGAAVTVFESRTGIPEIQGRLLTKLE